MTVPPACAVHSQHNPKDGDNSLIRTRVAPLIAAAALMMSVMPGHAHAEGEGCPLITEADMTGAVGAPTTLLPFDGAVNEIGRVTSCISPASWALLLLRELLTLLMPRHRTRSHRNRLPW